jgi:hypothetical protein
LTKSTIGIPNAKIGTERRKSLAMNVGAKYKWASGAGLI